VRSLARHAVINGQNPRDMSAEDVGRLALDMWHTAEVGFVEYGESYRRLNTFHEKQNRESSPDFLKRVRKWDASRPTREAA